MMLSGTKHTDSMTDCAVCVVYVAPIPTGHVVLKTH